MRTERWMGFVVKIIYYKIWKNRFKVVLEQFMPNKSKLMRKIYIRNIVSGKYMQAQTLAKIIIIIMIIFG